MDRWLIPTVAAVVALAIGFGIGAAVYDDDDAVETTVTPDDDAESPMVGDVDVAAQDTCLAALDTAEQELQAGERLSTLLSEYESLIMRSSEALADLDTRRLEQLLSEVEDLNRRSERLVDESQDADLMAAIDTCRSVLGVST